MFGHWKRSLQTDLLIDLSRHKSKRNSRSLLAVPFCAMVDRLEDRLLLSIASAVDQPLSTVPAPIDAQLGRIDADDHLDLVVLGASGELTVALNGGDDHWREVHSVDLGADAVHGMALGLVDDDEILDLVFQTSDSIGVAIGDGTGGFVIQQTLFAESDGALSPSEAGRLGLSVTDLDADLVNDIVALAPGSDQVLIFHGIGEGAFAAPDRYDSGADEPIDLWVGPFIGSPASDIAVAHADGTLTFLEGLGTGSFQCRPDLLIDGLGSLTDVTAADFDGNGELDLAVSGADGAQLLLNDGDVQVTDPIVNGDFSDGLSGWSTQLIGHGERQTPGTIEADGEVVRFTENESFLVSLQQTFLITAAPADEQTLVIDLAELALEEAVGTVPDAFELSLLDDQLCSLVPTHRPEATSFFSIGPDGEALLGQGVTFDGTTVTLDTSGLSAGAEATLYVDLVGNPPVTMSTVTIDKVRFESATASADTFTTVALSGPITGATGIAHGDVDGDSTLDIVLADAGAGVVLVYNGDGAGGLTRSEIDLAGLGNVPTTLAVASLTAGDDIDDVVVLFADADLAASPLAFDSKSTMPGTRFLVVDGCADSAFRYSTIGESTGQFELTGSRRPRGAATTGAGNPLWVVDQNRQVYVYDTAAESLLGSWQAKGLFRPEGIATDGSDIWIVDDTKDRVLCYVGAASLRSGRQRADQSFRLARDNRHPSGITTDGETIWVTDWLSDKVFVYDHNGDLLDWWRLDRRNGWAAGVTIDPTGNDPGLWVVDKQDDMVYYYAQATAVDRHRQASTASFPLASGNSHPEGIADPATPLSIGEIVTGTIDVAGEVESYTFNAAAGQSLYFDHQGGWGYLFNWRLTDPLGSVVFDSELGDRGPIDLGTTGGYVLDITGINNATGSYQFQVFDVPAPVTAVFSLGDVVSASIDVPGELDIYTFDASAGQSLFVDHQGGYGFNYTWTLTDPTGTELFRCDLGDREALIIDSTGTYTLVVDGNGAATGYYQFQISAIPEPVTTAIEVGSVIGATIDVPGEFDIYTFAGIAGQQLYFDHQAGYGFNYTWTLRDPNEAVLFSADLNDREGVTLDTTGQYTLVVDGSGSATGYYQFQIFDVPLAVPVAIAPGDLVGATIDVPGEVDVYTFDGSAGQTLFLDQRVGHSYNFTWMLTDSAGDVVVTGSFEDLRPVSLASDGQYRLLLDGNNSVTGFYEFQLWDVPADIPQPIQLDELVSASMAPTQTSTYTFQAVAGLDVVFDVRANDSSHVVFTLTDPLGNSLFDRVADDAPLGPLTVSGTYTLRAESADPSDLDLTGAYSFQLQASVDGPTLSIQAPIADQELPAGSEQLITGRALPGDSLLEIVSVTVDGQPVEALDAAGNFFAVATVQEGLNAFQVVATDSIGGQASMTLPVTGVTPAVDPVDLDNLRDVTSLVRIEYRNTTFNRQLQTLYVETLLTNVSDEPLAVPLLAAVSGLPAQTVTVADPDGTMPAPDSRPFLLFDDEIASSDLEPGQTSGPLLVGLGSLDMQRFELDVSVLVEQNTAPSFTSVPVLEAVAGSSYQYGAEASDTNGNALRFELSGSPAGMAIDALTGVVTWTPTLEQIGLHEVTIQVTDGHGGQVTQDYVLRVVAPQQDGDDSAGGGSSAGLPVADAIDVVLSLPLEVI